VLDLPQDLADLARIWPQLPGHIKSAIMTLIESCGVIQEPMDRPADVPEK